MRFAAVFVAWLRSLGGVLRPHGLGMALVVGLSLFLAWPLLRPGFAPGNDTPTFLHMSWFVNRLLTGAERGLTDPYWYGGFSPLFAYPPLSYTLVAVLALLPGVSLAGAYTAALLAAYAGLGLAVYYLALEMGVSRLLATLAGLMAVAAYPVMTGVGLWGWYTTVAALPFAIVSWALLERGLRLRSRRLTVVAGVVFGLVVLTHHTTSFGVGVALLAWGAFYLVARVYRPRELVLAAGLFAAGTAVVSGWWLILFVRQVAQVDFVREVPGLWAVSLQAFVRAPVDPRFIGKYTYPSYVGIVHLALGVGGMLWAAMHPGRLSGTAVAALVLVALGLGEQVNPLIRLPPFNRTDVARFPVYAAPFFIILGVGMLQGVWEEAKQALGQRWRREWLVGLALAALALLMVIPLRDALVASQRLMRPYVVDSSVRQALSWLEENGTEGRVLGVGFWHWDNFLVPYYAGRPVVAGWYDEGARNWRPVLEIRHMMWSGEADGPRLYQLLDELEGRYVMVFDYYRVEHPQAFLDELRGQPELFEEVAKWERVVLFEVRRSGASVSLPRGVADTIMSFDARAGTSWGSWRASSPSYR
ncbi:MAG: hypothetical protein HYY00_08820 [Chloroflexi bacterium]|nr:hypothetical protein [Chloroflexota bacterium]